MRLFSDPPTKFRRKPIVQAVSWNPPCSLGSRLLEPRPAGAIKTYSTRALIDYWNKTKS